MLSSSTPYRRAPSAISFGIKPKKLPVPIAGSKIRLLPFTPISDKAL